MNWGDIQLESLRKMFLNNDVLTINNMSTYKTDKNYKTYLDAMPGACNEAINYILEHGKPVIDYHELVRTDTNDKYVLNDLISDLRKVSSITFSKGTPEFYIIGDNILVINGWTEGTCTIYYEKQLADIDSTTDVTATTGLSKKYAKLIPLYIAGQLYKDYDIQIATIYMNEFISTVDSFSMTDGVPYNQGIKSVYEMR